MAFQIQQFVMKVTDTKKPKLQRLSLQLFGDTNAQGSSAAQLDGLEDGIITRRPLHVPSQWEL